MQISIGLSGLLTPRRWRMARRGSALLGAVWGGFVFLTVDLVRNDAHFSPGAWLTDGSTLEVELRNNATVPMQNANISFRFYDANGSLIIQDLNEDGVFSAEDLPEHRFDPANMLISGVFAP